MLIAMILRIEILRALETTRGGRQRLLVNAIQQFLFLLSTMGVKFLAMFKSWLRFSKDSIPQTRVLIGNVREKRRHCSAVRPSSVMGCPRPARLFIPMGADIAAVEFGKDLFLKTAVVCIHGVNRQLAGIPVEVLIQHFSENVRAFCDP